MKRNDAGQRTKKSGTKQGGSGHSKADDGSQQREGKKSKKKKAKNADDGDTDDNDSEEEIKQKQEKEATAPLIAIIPRKFAQHLDQGLVQTVNNLPSPSEKRLEALKIIKDSNQMLKDSEQITEEMIDDLSNLLAVLVEGGSNVGMEKKKEPPVSAPKANATEGRKTKFSAEFANVGVGDCPKVLSADEMQIAPFQQKQMMKMPGSMATTLMPPSYAAGQQQPTAAAFHQQLMSSKTPAGNSLMACSSAIQNLAQPSLSNLFELSANGTNQMAMMLSPTTFAPHGQINLVGSGELAKADLNMTGIENGIANALEKGWSARGAKACETVGNMWQQQNVTAREKILEGHKTLRHHDDNILMQNMHLMDSKKELALKEIEKDKQVAFKDIKARVMTGKEIVEKTFRLKKEHMASMHMENMETIKSNHMENMTKITSDHTEKMGQMEYAFKVHRNNMHLEHMQKMVAQTEGNANSMKALIQGENERMEYYFDKMSEKEMEYELQWKKMDQQRELKKMEQEEARKNAELNHRLAMEQLKMQQELSAAAAANSPSASQLSSNLGAQSQPGASSSTSSAGGDAQMNLSNKNVAGVEMKKEQQDDAKTVELEPDEEAKGGKEEDGTKPIITEVDEADDLAHNVGENGGDGN